MAHHTNYTTSDLDTFFDNHPEITATSDHHVAQLFIEGIMTVISEESINKLRNLIKHTKHLFVSDDILNGPLLWLRRECPLGRAGLVFEHSFGDLEIIDGVQYADICIRNVNQFELLLNNTGDIIIRSLRCIMRDDHLYLDELLLLDDIVQENIEVCCGKGIFDNMNMLEILFQKFKSMVIICEKEYDITPILPSLQGKPLMVTSVKDSRETCQGCGLLTISTYMSNVPQSLAHDEVSLLYHPRFKPLTIYLDNQEVDITFSTVCIHDRNIPTSVLPA